ncbi:MAG: phosphocholine cytidylyltransferase family protein [Deltaproteobacteria bacterium]|nr:phosphocholine cytidylyltransferase family protein [Deltaproteobacteria bacterium]MCW5805930.1 phosphocholine cytidylyltransferase family protein [Deltaproteobacteria bacterium]
MKALILAAGVGSRLAPLTNDRPKALVDVLGRSFLLRQLDRLAAAGIAARDVVIVGGYRVDQLRATLAREGLPCTVVLNERYAEWNNFYSVLAAEKALAGHAYVQLDGDVILDEKLLPRLLAAPGEVALAVDVRPELDEETMKVRLADGRAAAISKQLDPATCAGEYIGITKLSAAASTAVFAELARFPAEGLTHEYYEYAFDRLMSSGRVPFSIVDVHDCSVLEIDTVADLAVAEDILRRRG